MNRCKMVLSQLIFIAPYLRPLSQPEEHPKARQDRGMVNLKFCEDLSHRHSVSETFNLGHTELVWFHDS